jgi:hypothetical protein
MTLSLYEQDRQTAMHRGAIYQYRPIFWLEPPLWLLRDIKWTPPRRAAVHGWNELFNAFRLHEQDNQEDVIARAKIRYVVILSSDFEAQRRQFKQVIVAPTYTLDPAEHRQSFLTRVRNNQYPSLFYLPPDPNYPEMGECYIDFREVQLLHKEFLREGKLDITFTTKAIKAAIYRYTQYLVCKEPAP